jgi:hypothetical protein
VARDHPVDEERLRDVAVHADDPLPVLLREHARPVREREQHVVPLRQEANGRGGLGIRERRTRDVEELAPLLVAEATQPLEPRERALDLRHVHHAPREAVKRGGGSRRLRVHSGAGYAASDRVAELIAELRSSDLRTDSRVLRALAHPARLAIFEYLRRRGGRPRRSARSARSSSTWCGQVDAIR